MELAVKEGNDVPEQPDRERRRLDDYFAEQSADRIAAVTLREMHVNKGSLPRLALYNRRINAARYATDADCVFLPYWNTTGRLVHGTVGITTLCHEKEGFFMHLISSTSSTNQNPPTVSEWLGETLTVSEWLKHQFRSSLVSWDLYLEAAVVHNQVMPDNPKASSWTDKYLHAGRTGARGPRARPDGYPGTMCAYETFKKCMYEHHVPGVSNTAACRNVRAHAVDSRHQTFGTPNVRHQSFAHYDVISDLLWLRDSLVSPLDTDPQEHHRRILKNLDIKLQLFEKRTPRENAVRIMTCGELIRKQMARSDYGTRIFFHVFGDLVNTVVQKVEQLKLAIMEKNAELKKLVDVGPDGSAPREEATEAATQLASHIATWVQEVESLVYGRDEICGGMVMELYAMCRILRRCFEHGIGTETGSDAPSRLTGHPLLGRNVVYYADRKHTDALQSFCLKNGFGIYAARSTASEASGTGRRSSPGLHGDLPGEAAVSMSTASSSVEIDRSFHFDPPADVYEAQIADISRVLLVEAQSSKVNFQRPGDGVPSAAGEKHLSPTRVLSERAITSILRDWCKHDERRSAR